MLIFVQNLGTNYEQSLDSTEERSLQIFNLRNISSV